MKIIQCVNQHDDTHNIVITDKIVEFDITNHRNETELLIKYSDDKIKRINKLKYVKII